MERLRLCLFTDSAEPSGVGKHMLTLARALHEECRVSVVARRTRGGRDLLRRAEGLGCRTFALDWWDRPNAWWKLVRFLQEESVQVFHTHAGVGWEGLPAPYAARQAGIPVTIRTEHLPYLLTEDRHRLWHSELLPHLHGLVCVSESSRESYLKEGVPRPLTRVIPNGVVPTEPTATRSATRKRLGIPADAPLVLTVGRLAAQKGHDVLLAALPAVLTARADACFVWAGSGPLAPKLECAITRQGVAGSVLLLGRRDDVPDLMAAADLLCLPSLFEGHPLVVLEAMQAGLPVVATAVPGTLEALRDGISGLLVPPLDPTSLAAAILATLADPAAAAARAGAARRLWEERFNSARMAADHLALYREALAAARPHAAAMQD